MRYKLVVEYDGTDYHGWQVQPNGPSVQSVLEEALRRLTGEALRIAAAGRTDAGVHAAGQVVSFTLAKPLPTETLIRALNALTPADISVTAADTVGDDFDPRRDASGRTYVYRIWNARQRSPFWRRFSWHVATPLDVVAMGEAAAALLGEHDFSAFRAAGCDAENPVRRVRRSEVGRDGPMVSYTIEATAFLRHMVRNIVGTLVEVGRGTRGAAEVARLLAGRDRTQAGPTAPARGLCLTEVRYDPRRPPARNA